MLKQSRRVFRVPTLQQKRSYNGCVNPCVEYCISRSVYCRISSTGNRVIFELPLSKHNFITDGFTRFFGSISRTDSRNQSQSQSPKWETPDTIQSKEECKAWKILQGMKTSGKRGRNSQTERTDEKLRPTVISDNAQLMNELGGLERLGEVFNKIIWSVDVIRGLVAGDEGAIKNWRNITLNVVALRKLITKMVGQIGENDDENCGVIKRIFLDGISRQSSRLFSLLVDQIERLPLDLIREALLLSDMLDGHHSTYSRTPTTKNLSLPLTALSSGEISETTLSSLFRNAFIDRLSMNEVLDASTIRNVIQFTKQYANDVEQLTELNHIWIRMIQNLITPSCLLIDRNSARTDDFEIPTAHEVLAIIRFIARIVPTDRNFPPTNHLAAFCSNSVGRNSTTALDDILPCTDDKTPIHPIALQPHLNESKDRSHIDILSPLSVESMTRINALLGPNWRHILSALFLSPLWEFALPRQLAESLYLGWRLGTLSSTSIEFLTTRLADMEPLLGSNSPLHSPNIATSSSLPNSECRYLFLLLSMVKSSSIQTLGPAKTSCPNISGRLIKHLSQSATSNIPSSVSMSALIAFTTAVVRLGLRVPKLRRRLVVDMQRGDRYSWAWSDTIVLIWHGMIFRKVLNNSMNNFSHTTSIKSFSGKLMQLTPDLFLTALSHFQFLGIQRSDESHTFVVSYVKKKLPEFTPNQLLILLSLVPRHITRLDEAKSALLPPMRNLVRLFERFVGPPVNRLIQNCSSVNTPNSEHPASRDSASRDSASTDSASTDLELRDLELGDLEMREGFVHPFMKTISICDVVLAIDSLRPLAGRSMPLSVFMFVFLNIITRPHKYCPSTDQRFKASWQVVWIWLVWKGCNPQLMICLSPDLRRS